MRAHTARRGWSYLVNAPRKEGQLVCGTIFYAMICLSFCKIHTKNWELHLCQTSHLLPVIVSSLDSVPEPVHKAPPSIRFAHSRKSNR